MMMPANDIGVDMAACAMGISVAGQMIEVCVMAQRGDVVMHAWFPKKSVLSVLGHRPPCHIAFAGEPLPLDVIASFQALGHAAIMVSERGMERTVRTGRLAADVCRVALQHAETFAGSSRRRAN